MRLRRRHLRSGARRTRRRPRRRRDVPRSRRLRRDRPARRALARVRRRAAPHLGGRRDADWCATPPTPGSRCSACASAANSWPRRSAGRWRGRPTPEIGWYDVDTDQPEMVPGGPWFQWHFDRWTLPPGATEIARTANSSQAFVLGRALALQFHPEIDYDTARLVAGRRPRRRSRRRRAQPRRITGPHNRTRRRRRQRESAAWCAAS